VIGIRSCFSIEFVGKSSRQAQKSHNTAIHAQQKLVLNCFSMATSRIHKEIHSPQAFNGKGIQKKLKFCAMRHIW